jgi:ABC-type branched-subunit amino acid transport system substrate-binding protein
MCSIEQLSNKGGPEMALKSHRFRVRNVVAICSMTALTPILAVGGSSTAGASTTATNRSSASIASGSPIDIQMPNLQGSTQGVNIPAASQAAMAAVQWVNHHGGVHGHPLALTVCDLLTTPASDTGCANSMAAANPVAIVGGAVDDGTPIVTQAGAAGIPYVTTAPGSPAELSGPNAFAFGPGALGFYNSVATNEVAKKGKSVALVLIGAPASLPEVKAGAEPEFKAHHIGLNVIITPLSQVDFTPTIQASTRPPATGVFVVESTSGCISALNAKGTLQVSSHIRFYVSFSCQDPSVVAGARAQFNGTYVTTLGDASNPADPDYADYQAAMKKYAPSTPPLGYAVAGYAGVMDLVRVMQKMSPSKTINAANVMTALKGAKNVKAFLGDGSTFTCGGTVDKALPSLCSGSSYLDQYVHGKYKFIRRSSIPGT